MFNPRNAGLPNIAALGVWLCLVSAAVCLADVPPHPDWFNYLQPRGEPGPPLTLARDGQTEYAILLPAAPTG